MTVPRKTPPECPIERCISVLSGRWKAMIVWRLFVEPQRYSALERQMPMLSQRALSQALSELATDGVIERAGEKWALTPLGKAMRPALSAMFAWGSLHKSHADAEEVLDLAEMPLSTAGAGYEGTLRSIKGETQAPAADIFSLDQSRGEHVRDGDGLD